MGNTYQSKDLSRVTAETEGLLSKTIEGNATQPKISKEAKIKTDGFLCIAASTLKKLFQNLLSVGSYYVNKLTGEGQVEKVSASTTSTLVRPLCI